MSSIERLLFAGSLALLASSAGAAEHLPAASFIKLERLAPQSRAPFDAVPLSAAALAARRGGERTGSDTQLTGAVTGNQAVNVTTGGNVISDGAFAGAAGVSTVIQNSGNNVLIQNATIVNLQLK